MSDTATHLAALLAALDAASRHTRGMPADGVSFDPEDPTLPARQALANLRRHLAGTEVELGDLRRRVDAAQALWVDAKATPPAEMTRGGSGWSPWVMGTDVTRVIDDGPMIFTAAYSHALHRWHAIGNERVSVTHWQPLPLRPVQQPVAPAAAPG